MLEKPSADSPKTAKSQPGRKAVKAKSGKDKAARPKATKAKVASKRGGKKPSTKGSEPAGGRTKALPNSRRKPGRSTKRLPPRQTFLVATTLVTGNEPPQLRVYAAVVRGAAEALEAVRAEFGPEVAVELTGKLSNRMTKALGLKPGEVRPV